MATNLTDGRDNQGKPSRAKHFFLEISEDDVISKDKLYQWFVEDGYVFDMFAAGVIIAINSLVALQAIMPIHRLILIYIYRFFRSF